MKKLKQTPKQFVIATIHSGNSKRINQVLTSYWSYKRKKNIIGVAKKIFDGV